MRRIAILLAAMTLSVWTASAQNAEGQFSLRPVAGVVLTDFAGNADDIDLYKMKVGFTGGLEAEYGIKPWLGVSLGAFYSQQGAKYKGAMKAEGYDDHGNHIVSIAQVRGKVKVDYINLPLLANFYVWKGLALKTGLQMGILANDVLTYDLMIATAQELPTDVWILEDPSKSTSTVASMSGSSTDFCKSIDLGIPVGISYEYKGFTLDTRYVFGLTNIDDSGDTGSVLNRCLTITLGYRFKL